ncbi:MAG: N-acetyltransferase family protein [Dehalococcoidia bacterium]|jgi:phosphinothricin acetyltransferase
MDNLTFRKAEGKDSESILELYNFYIVTTTATFDQDKISMEEFRQRIYIGHEKYQTYVSQYCNEMAGFCFLTQYRKKEAYDRTAEIGVYLKPEFTGKGIGSSTVAFLEKVASSKQIRVVLASISGENTASIKLFQKTGFEKCAHYREVGEKFGRILDIVDYQKILGT